MPDVSDNPTGVPQEGDGTQPSTPEDHPAGAGAGAALDVAQLQAAASGASAAGDAATDAKELSTEAADTAEASASDQTPRAAPTPPVHPEDEAQAAPSEPISEETSIPRHFTAPARVALDRVDDDDAFLVRDPAELGDVAALATDIARLGQLFPIDVRLKAPDRFQVISGFRRVAALRFLHREKVLARLHTDVSDSDAMLMSLAASIHGRAVGRPALEKMKERLERAGRLGNAARDMLEKALSVGDELSPETVGEDEEVDADELAADATERLGVLNQDLSLLADVFGDLEPAQREALLTQLRYASDLVAFLEQKR